MQIRRWFRLAGMAAAVLTIGVVRTDAGVISNINQFLLPGSSTGSLTFSPAVAPNNDNTAAPSANTIANPGFGVFLNAGGFGILDYEFDVADSGGTTEYLFTTNMVNNSGIAWDDFHFLLGFGTGPAFVPVGAGVALDFDTPDRDPAATSSVFTVLNHQPNVVEWSGGTVNYLGGPGGMPFSVGFSLSIDVPDGLAALHPQGVNRFTLRSFPTAQQVPEPTAIALIGVALVGAALRQRGRN
jgi:hypothetical protein